jgi:YVTN family beta-propeller protein
MSLRDGFWRWGFGLVLVAACVLGVAGRAWAATAYVANFNSGTVTPIEVATNKPGPEIKVGTNPIAVAITRDGKTAYVTNDGSNSVTPIDVATNKPGAEIKVGTSPIAVAITPDGKTAYVTNEIGGTVTPIDVATNKPGPEIKVGSTPFGVAITPDSKTAYVTNDGSNSVTPIEVATNKPGLEVKVGKQPWGVAITPAAATCTTNTGTLTLSPGLTSTPAVQTLKIKGTLTGCTGKPFTGTKYTATLKTAGPVSCSVLKAAGETATGTAAYTWTPKAKASKGTLSLPLTETPGVAFSGKVATGSYSPLTLSGTLSQRYTGAATCSTKAVKKGTFTGSAVTFE